MEDYYMARVDFGLLDKIIKDESSESRSAGDSSICLSQFLNIISNITSQANDFTESDLALLTKSLQQFLHRRSFTSCKEEIKVGDIFNIDFGINYEPEMSYNHPGLILEEVGDLVLAVPTSTSTKKLQNAYHHTKNKNGNWYYYEVDKSDGFAERCVLILGNVCTISKGRLLEKKGHLTCDISDENSLYREIRNIMLQHLFSKEYNKLTSKIFELEQKYNK